MAQAPFYSNNNNNNDNNNDYSDRRVRVNDIDMSDNHHHNTYNYHYHVPANANPLLLPQQNAMPQQGQQGGGAAANQQQQQQPQQAQAPNPPNPPPNAPANVPANVPNRPPNVPPPDEQNNGNCDDSKCNDRPCKSTINMCGNGKNVHTIVMNFGSVRGAAELGNLLPDTIQNVVENLGLGQTLQFKGVAMVQQNVHVKFSSALNEQMIPNNWSNVIRNALQESIDILLVANGNNDAL